MKKKLSRQILYTPSLKTTPKVDEERKVEVEKKEEIKKSEKDRSIFLYKWLNDRPFIKLNSVCKKIGVDRGNFVKGAAVGKELKSDILEKIEKELGKYGFGV